MRRKTRRNLIILSLASGLLFAWSGEASAFTTWIRQFPESDVRSVAAFDQNNIYVASTLYGQIGGTPPRGTLIKFDGSGNRLWSRVPNVDPYQYVNGVAVDTAGNAYVVGSRGSSQYSLDMYVAKYSAAGAQQWQSTISRGTSQYASDIKVASDGSIYLTGIDNFFGNRAIMTVKLNGSGFVQWTRIVDTPAQDSGHGVAVDGSGNAYVSGTSNGAYLAKYSSAGVLGWSAFFPTTFFDAYDVAFDGGSYLYVIGRGYGTIDGVTSHNAWIRKYDLNGVAQWTRQFGTPSTDGANGVAATANGRVYVAGFTYGTFPNQVAAGDSDAFVRYFNSAGTAIDTDQFGTSGYDNAHAVAGDASNNTYVSGSTDGTFPGNTHHSPAGYIDGFLGKFYLRACTPLEIYFGVCTA